MHNPLTTLEEKKENFAFPVKHSSTCTQDRTFKGKERAAPCGVLLGALILIQSKPKKSARMN